jgi:hypothetical protein
MSIATYTNGGEPAPLTYPDGLPDNVAPLGERADGLFRGLLLTVGVAALALILGVVVDLKQFYHSYLFGYVFALDIALGALFWTMIHHVADAGWSVGLRRIFENMNRAIVPLALLFVPVLIGTFTGELYDWYGSPCISQSGSSIRSPCATGRPPRTRLAVAPSRGKCSGGLHPESRSWG